jgi:hypothetical protein
MIDTTNVETRNGQPVTIIATNCRGAYPIIGYIGRDESNTLELSHWTSDGRFAGTDNRLNASPNLDLIEKEQTLWLYVVDDRGYVYTSRSAAQPDVVNNAIARIKVKFKPGQFDT